MDGPAGAVLGSWYELTARVLESFRAELGEGAAPSPLVLRPEHFGQAFSAGDGQESRRANYGASPGDDRHPDPYLYVGPWGRFEADPYWSASHFPGAVLPRGALARASAPEATALAFLRRGRRLLTAAPADRPIGAVPGG